MCPNLYLYNAEGALRCVLKITGVCLLLCFPLGRYVSPLLSYLLGKLKIRLYNK